MDNKISILLYKALTRAILLFCIITSQTTTCSAQPVICNAQAAIYSAQPVICSAKTTTYSSAQPTTCSAKVADSVVSSYWTTDSAWYHAKDSINSGKIDLIYLVSVNVVSATDANGRKVYRAQLTQDDRRILDLEFAYVEKHLGQGDFNYIAPYYHQFTFDAIGLPAEKFNEERCAVTNEVCAAFDYYMNHINNGRQYALVGFSQGAMLVLDLLKHMTKEQYSKMVAAYAIGESIKAEDVKCERIIPATDETTPGVTVSFNSALSNEGLWSLVAADAVAAINPVNWRTDTTAATFTYEGCLHKVHLDSTSKLLLVETANADKYRQWNGNPIFRSVDVPLDCLHHWDILFYNSFLHDNIIKRTTKTVMNK